MEVSKEILSRLPQYLSEDIRKIFLAYKDYDFSLLNQLVSGIYRRDYATFVMLTSPYMKKASLLKDEEIWKKYQQKFKSEGLPGNTSEILAGIFATHLDRQFEAKNKKLVINNIIRWFILVPSILLLTLPLIYTIRFMGIQWLLMPQENSSYLIPAIINFGVPMIQIYVANWIAPSHKRIVSLVLFGVVSILFLLSVITIVIEARFFENLWSSITYFFQESWLEFLRPLSAWFVIKELGYWERKK